MKVLITGITGFIGGELAHRLLEEGHEVSGFIPHVVLRNFDSLSDIKDKINLITCDIRDYQSVRDSLKKVNPDVVLHLAALSPVRLSFENPFSYQEINYLGAINVAEAIRELYGPEKVRLVAASTAEVYGIQDSVAFTEDMSLKPSSPYSVAKAGMDMYLRMLNIVYGFNVVILRNSNTFGRKYDPGFFTEYLITKMLTGEDIYIGAPDSVRDYIYVDDHVNAYILAMQSPSAKGEAINIAGGTGWTNKEWALKIADLIGFPKEKIHLGQYPPKYPYRPLASDQPYLVLNADKAKRVLGWSQTVNPDEGLKMSIEYWKQKLK